MQVLYINNQGGGYADHIDVPEGTTVAQLFQQRMTGCEATDFMIRVDRLPAAADQVLHPGARVTITPLKIEGALPAAAA
jgi:hypothetical protein